MISSVQPTYTPTMTGNNSTLKERQEQVAAGVGATGATTSAVATKIANRKAVKAQAAEGSLKAMMESAQNATRTVNKNKQVATGLIETFNKNVKIFTQDLLTRLSKYSEVKYIKAIVNSPVTKKLAGLAGGALAFFVLVTGVNKAVDNGKFAVADIKNKLDRVAA